MRALVTGGAGFIGSHLVDLLVAEGTEVDIVDDLSSGRRENVAAALENGARLHVCSVLDADGLSAVWRDAGPDIVFHLAAQIDVRRSVDDPAFDAMLNVIGTVNVLEAARHGGARRVVLASTGGAIYGDSAVVPTPETAAMAPLSPYGTSKACAEAYLAIYERLHGLSTVALRLANVYGPRQDPHGEAGVVAIFCRAASTGLPATVYGDGTQTRDYLFVGDAVAAFAAAGRATVTGALNIGTRRETTVLDLAGELGLEVIHAPGRPGEVARSALEASAAAEALGWSPRTVLGEGVRRTLQAFA